MTNSDEIVEAEFVRFIQSGELDKLKEISSYMQQTPSVHSNGSPSEIVNAERKELRASAHRF